MRAGAGAGVGEREGIKRVGSTASIVCRVPTIDTAGIRYTLIIGTSCSARAGVGGGGNASLQGRNLPR